jgi:PTH1 family peptidyl-tRNA hydrolase
VDPIHIVLGLGNPGPRYCETRHNIGFHVLDRLAGDHGGTFRRSGLLRPKVWRTTIESASGPVQLAKPRTFMNRSGDAAASVLRDMACPAEQMLVVYDDADLEFGRIRLREGGGTGGHNGIRSLIDRLGSRDFRRVRLGIRGLGREEQNLADYVLSPFDPVELPHLQKLVNLGVQAVEATLSHGFRAAMDGFNRRNAALDPDPPG